MSEDAYWMGRCLELAREGKGAALPNPCVGACLLDASGRQVGQGVTAAGGRPHAEIRALESAGTSARGGKLYVTLEPCVPFPAKKSGACSEAIARAGIAEVIVGALDPNPHVRGEGMASLLRAGLKARIHPELEPGIADFYGGFGIHCCEKRPRITVKVAVSSDGFAASGPGRRTKITSPESDAIIHGLRSGCDGILIGKSTLLVDDARLTVRMAAGKSPERFVLWTGGRVPGHLRILDTRAAKTTFLGLERPESLPEDVGFLSVPGNGDGRLDLAGAMRRLGNRGLHDLLIEPGPSLWASLLSAGLWDRLWIYRSPVRLEEGIRFDLSPFEGTVPTEHHRFGPDSASLHHRTGGWGSDR